MYEMFDDGKRRNAVEISDHFPNGSRCYALSAGTGDAVFVAYCAEKNVYVEKLRLSGEREWGPVAVQSGVTNVKDVDLFVSLEGDIFVAWIDYMNMYDGNIFLSSISLQGKIQRQEPVKLNEDLLHSPGSMHLNEGPEGIIAVWVDTRNGISDIRIK